MLKQRIITAVIAALLLLAVLFVLPQLAARVVIALVILVGAWEWSGFLSVSRVGRYTFVMIIVAMIVPAIFWINVYGVREVVFQIALGWWVIAFIWIFFFPTPIATPVVWFSGILTIVPAYVALDWLYLNGAGTLLFMLVIVLAADIGAYFSGKAFGKVKLAPQISPGKTWEGAIGGLLLVAIVIGVESIVLDFPLLTVLPLCLAVAVISVVGDLTVSMFKRTSGVKDSGTLFPGHGGVLDRADSIMAAAPVFALGITWLSPWLSGFSS